MEAPRREILFIAHRVPFPPDRGDKIRSYNELRHLATLAPVHLAAFADDARDLGHDAALSALTASHCIVPRNMSRGRAALRGLLTGEPFSVALFRDKALRDYVAHIVATRPLAAIFVFSGQMAAYVPADRHGARFVMDFCDMDSAKFAAYGSEGRGPMALVNRREGRVLARFERKTALRADAALFVSEAEATLFRAMEGMADAPVHVLRNGVDLAHYDPTQEREVPAEMAAIRGARIVFTGQMDYRPNVEAVVDFARRALPAIRAAHANAHFLIVGRSPTEAVRALVREPGVVVTGEVSDVRGYLKAADVVVAPLRIARGIQNKVLEAMAMARPVVASREAAEGIGAQDGRDFLVARTPADEARLVDTILDDPVRAHAIGQAARAFVEARYSWAAALAPLDAMVMGA